MAKRTTSWADSTKSVGDDIHILATRHDGTLDSGVASDIRARLERHRSGRGSKFVPKHKVLRLVHVEALAIPKEAGRRDKQLKFRKRDRKIKLID